MYISHQNELATGGGVQIEHFPFASHNSGAAGRTSQRPNKGHGRVPYINCGPILFLFGGGPLLLEAPVHVHMLHMPNSGPEMDTEACLWHSQINKTKSSTCIRSLAYFLLFLF